MQTSTPMPERTVPASLNVESTLSNQPLNRYQTTALEAVISNYIGFLKPQGLSDEAIQAKLASLLRQV